MNEFEQVNASQGGGYHLHHNHEDTSMSGQNLDIQSLGGGFGGGSGGLVAGLVLGAILNRRGFGDGGCDGAAVSPIDIATLNAVNNNTAQIPTVALQVQTAIAEQTNELSGQFSTGVLGLTAGIAQVRDTVQGASFGILAAINNNTERVIAAVQSVKDQASAYRISDLERQLTVAQTNDLHERIGRRLDSVEVNVSQNVTQSQAQGQIQAQLQAQGFALAQLAGVLHENTQLSRAAAANTNLIVGSTGVATGAQSANPTSTNVKG